MEKRLASGDEDYHQHLPEDERDYWECMNIGTQFWSEFISDVLCYRVEATESRQSAAVLSAHLSSLIQKSIVGTPLHVDTFGHYCAMVLAEPTICRYRQEGKKLNSGLECIEEEARDEVTSILHLLEVQMMKENVCAIKKEDVLRFGAIINEIWSINAETNFKLLCAAMADSKRSK